MCKVWAVSQRLATAAVAASMPAVTKNAAGSGPSRPAVRPRAALVRGSGLPMPRRRTFVPPILAILFGTAVAVSSFVNRARPSRPAVRPRAALVRGSGLPMPHRRTFASGIVPAAHCMSAALRHPGYACSHSPAPGHGQPLAEFVRVPPDAASLPMLKEAVGGHAQTSGECLRLSGDSQSASRASWSKTPRRRACPPPANQGGAASVAGRPRRPRPPRCGYETVRLPISSSTLSLSLPRIGHEAMRRIVTFRVSPRKRASSRSSSQRGPFTTSIRP